MFSFDIPEAPDIPRPWDDEEYDDEEE